MMLSRKHYRAIAGAFKEQVDIINVNQAFSSHDRELQLRALRVVAERLALHLKSDNPNFNRQRFFEACGLED